MSTDLLERLQAATSETQVSWLITQALLQSLPRAVAEAAEAAAVPHWFDAGVLQAALAVDSARAEALLREITALTFCEHLGDFGWALHDTTRTAILKQILATDITRFQTYTERLRDYFSQQEGTQSEVEATYHAMAAAPAEAVALFEMRMRQYRRFFEYGAASNLLRDAEDLIALNIIAANDGPRIERERFRMASAVLEDLRQPSKAPDDLRSQALAMLSARPATELAETQRLDAAVDTQHLRRQYVKSKIENALSENAAEKSLWMTELAEVEQDAKDLETALNHSTAAIELDSRSAEAHATRGETYRLMKRYEEALADFTRAIELDDKYAWAIGSRGETYRQMSRYEEALADFSRAIELDGKYTWAITSRGETYRLLKRYEEALADFSRAIELDDKYVWAIASRGQTYRLLDRYEEALADFSRAIELDDKDAGMIVLRGITYRLLDRYEEALADFSRAIELDDKYTWAIASRGETYRLMKRYEEALADFSRAIELDDKVAWAIASRGETYRLMKRYEEALADFSRAIELDGKDAWAITSRGETYRLLKRYEEALADFSRAIELDPTRNWVHYQASLVHSQCTNTAEAISQLNAAIALARSARTKEPFDWNSHFNLALYLLAAGESTEAISLYELALKSSEVTRWHLLPALEDLTEFLAIYPDHVEAKKAMQLVKAHLS
jgi:tetratricopeptide (TPR) repeat protein